MATIQITEITKITEIFESYCLSDNPDNAKRFFSLHHDKIDIHRNNENLFKQLCLNPKSKLETAKWLYDLSIHIGSPIDLHSIDNDGDDIFTKCCLRQNLKAAELLYNFGLTAKKPFDIHAKSEKIFTQSVMLYHIDTAEWIYNIGKTMNSPINIHIDDDKLFKDIISAGSNMHNKFQILMWLYKLAASENSTFNMSSYCGTLFVESCGKNLDFAKWLYEMKKLNNIFFDLDAIIDDAFLNCFKHNNEYNHESADWLLEVCNLLKISLNAETYVSAFISSCECGRLSKAQWLVLLRSKTDSPIDYHAKDNRAFILACAYGHIDTVKWLYDLSVTYDILPINIRMNNDECFRLCCQNAVNDIINNTRKYSGSDYYKVATWLANLCPDYIVNGDGYYGNKFCSARIIVKSIDFNTTNDNIKLKNQ